MRQNAVLLNIILLYQHFNLNESATRVNKHILQANQSTNSEQVVAFEARCPFLINLPINSDKKSLLTCKLTLNNVIQQNTTMLLMKLETAGLILDDTLFRA